MRSNLFFPSLAAAAAAAAAAVAAVCSSGRHSEVCVAVCCSVLQRVAAC